MIFIHPPFYYEGTLKDELTYPRSLPEYGHNYDSDSKGQWQPAYQESYPESSQHLSNHSTTKLLHYTHATLDYVLLKPRLSQGLRVTWFIEGKLSGERERAAPHVPMVGIDGQTRRESPEME